MASIFKRHRLFSLVVSMALAELIGMNALKPKGCIKVLYLINIDDTYPLRRPSFLEK